jgi:NAD+ kinase
VERSTASTVQPGESFEMRLRPEAGLVVRLDRERHLRRNQVKLSLLDLPFLPDELRELVPQELPPPR